MERGHSLWAAEKTLETRGPGSQLTEGGEIAPTLLDPRSGHVRNSEAVGLEGGFCVDYGDVLAIYLGVIT